MASNQHKTNGMTTGRFRLIHLAAAGGAVMLLAACGTRGLTTAEPAARVVSICPTPGKARMACDQDDQREIAAARRLIERQRAAAGAATTAATTTPTTAATTTSTAATTTVPETTTVATEATAAPAPEETAPPVEAAPVEEAPAEEAAPVEEAPVEEEPATTAAKRKPKTPRTTAAPVEEPPAAEAPPATEAPAPPPPADVQVDTSVAGRVIALTNAQRAAAGLGPVSANGALTAAAAAHSKDQAAHNKMTHTGSNGSTLGQRVTAAGFSWRTIGENVAMGYGSADSVMNGWMNSPGHKANILKADFTSIGVAVAYSADGTPYWTMDLGA